MIFVSMTYNLDFSKIVFLVSFVSSDLRGKSLITMFLTIVYRMFIVQILIVGLIAGLILFFFEGVAGLRY